VRMLGPLPGLDATKRRDGHVQGRHYPGAGGAGREGCEGGGRSAGSGELKVEPDGLRGPDAC
jgi:hypothetical protein